MDSKLRKEAHIKNIMIRMYCRKHHQKTGLCPDCQNLVDYSDERLAKCPFGENKPACNQCVVHCYNAIYRRQIKNVMRFAGPRMIWQHPIMGMRHLMTLIKR